MFIDVEELCDDSKNSRLTAQHIATSINILL